MCSKMMEIRGGRREEKKMEIQEMLMLIISMMDCG